MTGVHLCIADESISEIQTAEKKARADTTLVPTWIVMIEGDAATDVGAAGKVLATGLHERLDQVAPAIASIYQLESSRCKTPWSAG